MPRAGIIAEYNPLHRGHSFLMGEARRILGAETAVVCVMSGNFVQRGDFAVVDKRRRAAAAVASGADLVLELPLPWAVSSAEDFAKGAVETLAAAGVIDYLVFGSECGDAGALMRAASALESEAFSQRLRRELSSGTGISFPAARQRALAAAASPEEAALLGEPNNILGVEYCKQLLRLGSSIQPLAVLRRGAPHGGEGPGDAPYSASAIRALLRRGEIEAALAGMAPAMAEAFQEAQTAGEAPVFYENCERAVLARLRSMSRDEFAALDMGREGLSNRLWRASREACSVAQVLEGAKTKRYPLARLRRMVLWAWLGLRPALVPEHVTYLRPLAANAVGRALLAEMRTRAALPVLMKPGAVRRMPETARGVFELEARGTDLYALGFPRLEAARGGAEWRSGMVVL